MIIIQTVKNFPPGPRKVCIAIGVFDGVHLGHQQVIRQMVTDAEQQEARSVVITFDRHPNAIVAPDRVPPLIYSLSQKMRAIENLEAETTFLVHFDEAFSKQSGEQFVRRLAEVLHLAANEAGTWLCSKRWARTWALSFMALPRCPLTARW
jgi:riboflavin kinase/FMN adenylyltransferase